MPKTLKSSSLSHFATPEQRCGHFDGRGGGRGGVTEGTWLDRSLQVVFRAFASLKPLEDHAKTTKSHRMFDQSPWVFYL